MTLDTILAAALDLLDEGAGLSMRALAARLGVTAMSLYRHVADRTGLLVALSDRVYGGVLDGLDAGPPAAQLRTLLTRYHAAVGRHPQLTLAIFAEPAAFAGATVHITERVTTLLAELTTEPELWRDVLVDHAHGSALALLAADGARADGVHAAGVHAAGVHAAGVHAAAGHADALRAAYAHALDRLVALLPPPAPARRRRPPAGGHD